MCVCVCVFTLFIVSGRNSQLGTNKPEHLHIFLSGKGMSLNSEHSSDSYRREECHVPWGGLERALQGDGVFLFQL